MFLQNTPQSTKHALYTFCISCKFCVLLMPQKNKPRNPLTFCTNIEYRPWCEMLRNAKSEKRDPKREKSDAKYPAVHFLFLAFRDHFYIFCDKFIASLIM